MRIVLAREMGMCFGVRDALQVARGIADPRSVTMHGELVHNERVLEELDRRGFRRQPEADRTTPAPTARVLITAHGVSEGERERLRGQGAQLIDTTCPLVRFVHQSARELESRGYRVVVLGKPGHVEVKGIVGDLAAAVVVETEADVRAFAAPRLGVVCQTTMPPGRAAALLGAIRASNPASELRFVDTICGPTRNRQAALLELLEEVEALVVVGGRSSNNTRALAELAGSRGIPALRVAGPDELDAAWLAPYEVVGLTAGTSTLPETIEAVHEALVELAASDPVPAPQRSKDSWREAAESGIR